MSFLVPVPLIFCLHPTEVGSEQAAGWGFCCWQKANPPHRQGMTWRTQIDGSPEIHKYRNIPNMKEDHWNKWTIFAREQMGKSRADKYIYITNSKGVIFNPQIWKSLLLWTEWAKIWKPARTTEQFETKKAKQGQLITWLVWQWVSVVAVDSSCDMWSLLFFNKWEKYLIQRENPRILEIWLKWSEY